MIARAAERWSREYILARGFAFVDRPFSSRQLAYEVFLRPPRIFLRRIGAKGRCLHREESGRMNACPLVFSPDGRTLYRARGQIFAIELRSGAAKALTSLEGPGPVWDLYVTPDARTLYFLRDWQIWTAATDGSGTALLFDAGPPGEGVWRFACDFEKGLIRIVRGGKARKRYWVMDLDGRNSTPVMPPNFGTSSAASDAMELAHGGTVHVPRSPHEEKTDPETVFRVPSLSPDERSVAYVRDDHEIWLHRFGDTKATCVLRARRRQDTRPFEIGSYATAPVWSPDGRFLWFSSTRARRLDAPRNPAWLEQLRAKGTDDEMMKRQTEMQHWTYRFRSGVIDLRRRTIWMQSGYWRDVAWRPARRA